MHLEPTSENPRAPIYAATIHPERHRSCAAIFRSLGLVISLALLAIPAVAGIGDLDPTFAGGAGYKAFDLGKSFQICAMDVAEDGTTVLALNTTAGSEIWTVDPSGTSATHLKTYSFAGTTSCDEGLRDVTCPDGTYTCYAAGSLRQGGDADTWAVAFDRRNGSPDSSILQGGSEVVDLDPSSDDGANAICVSPVTGSAQEVMPAGTDGDAGMNLTIKPRGAWAANTVVVGQQPTEVLDQLVQGDYRWSVGDTRPGTGQHRYMWVCREKKDAKGNWVVDTSFGPHQNGCDKIVSDEEFRGFALGGYWRDQVVVLTSENVGSSHYALRLRSFSIDDGAGFSTGSPVDVSGSEPIVNLESAQLTCCDEGGGFILAWQGLRGGTNTQHYDWVPVPESEAHAGQFEAHGPAPSASDLLAAQGGLLADYLAGSQGSRSPQLASTVPEPEPYPSTLPSYDTVILVGRDGSTGDSNLVIERIQASYPQGPCVADAHTLCIDDQPGDKRYRVTVDYATTQGGRGGSPQAGNAIDLGSLGVTHGGLFWFFDAKNPEMLIKVLNGTNANQHRWVFYSAGTNVGLTTTVQDTQTGAVVTYDNPDRHPAAPVLDVGAFTADGQVGNSYQQTDKSFDYAQDFVQAPKASTTCATTDTSLCIDNRFEITVSYHTTQGGRDGSDQVGHAISLSSLNVDRGGLFWFFDKTNPEMLIKVLDACGLSGHYWVFYSAGTSVGLTTTVIDTANHLANTYTNSDKSQAPALLDQQAFPCP